MGEITAIIEGALHHSQDCLQYVDIDLPIPDDSKSLSIGKFFFPFMGFYNLEENRSLFSNTDMPRSISGGWTLMSKTDYVDDWIKHAFEYPRSIITSDGRFYLKDTLINPKTSYYLPHIFTVMEDAYLVFNGEKTIYDLNFQPKKIFF